METVGSRLKALRKKNKFTQRDISKILKIEQSTLSNYENDKTEPSIDMLIKFSYLYKESVDYIVGRYEISKF